MLFPHLSKRIALLEAAMQAHEAPRGEGLAALLDDARRHHITVDHIPLASRTEADLDAQIADLTTQVAAGADGSTRLLLEALMLYKHPAPRQEAEAQEPPA